MRSIRYFLAGSVVVGATLASLGAAGPAGAGVTSAAVSSVGTYQPVTPARILDTRSGIGTGGVVGPVAAGQIVHLQVEGAGDGEIPASGVSAVVLNMTETSATSGGFITVWPTGAKQPTVSNLNFTAGSTRANSVTVSLSSDGGVDIYSSAISAQLIVDVTGYFVGDAQQPAGGQFHLLALGRVLDTRTTTGALPAGKEITVGVNYVASVNSHIRALAVNITSVDSTAPGYLIAWSGTGNVPSASVLNFDKGVATPNMAIIPTATCTFTQCKGLPSITIYNGSHGSTQVLVDVVGMFDDGTLPGGMVFHPISPTRIVDTRGGQALGATKTANIALTAGLIDANTGALALNVTAVAPTATTYLTLFPSGIVVPGVSTLNATAKQTVANATIVQLGDAREFGVWNAAGTTNFLADLAGTYETTGQ